MEEVVVDLKTVMVVLVNLDPLLTLIQPQHGDPILVVEEVQMMMAAAVVVLVGAVVLLQVGQESNFLQHSEILR